ncbi:MAG TPA: chemotaxis protein CheX [Opitutaceae bacterium]|nr:chemotaxis protein CheX [Opitutaceae bacterium]
MPTPPPPPAIGETLIRDSIVRAVQDVFKTMLGEQVTFVGETPVSTDKSEHSPVPIAGSLPQVVGTVGFIGEINGLIYLYLPDNLSHKITCKLLGMTAAELEEAGDEVINDAIGEITNMTVGGFKNALCDVGYFCKLTIPSILRGSNFTVEPMSSTTRQIYNFDCGGSRVITDILMKFGD